MKEIIRPTSLKYTIELPEEYLHKDIVVSVQPLSDWKRGSNECLNAIRRTAGLLAGRDIDPVEWQRKIRQEWDSR